MTWFLFIVPALYQIHIASSMKSALGENSSPSSTYFKNQAVSEEFPAQSFPAKETVVIESAASSSTETVSSSSTETAASSSAEAVASSAVDAPKQLEEAAEISFPAESNVLTVAPAEAATVNSSQVESAVVNVLLSEPAAVNISQAESPAVHAASAEPAVSPAETDISNTSLVESDVNASQAETAVVVSSAVEPTAVSGEKDTSAPTSAPSVTSIASPAEPDVLTTGNNSSGTMNAGKFLG